MRNKRFTHISSHVILALILVLLAGSLVFAIANQANAEGDSVNTPEAAAAAVGTAFTYQGSLEKNGTPIDGTCDMVFRLYDDSGFKIGTNQHKNGVTVSDGLFSVTLDFGDEAFTGGARFLGTDVKCGGDSDFTTLLPNVPLTAAPYALSLRPGATVQGSDTTGQIISAVNTATGGGGSGLYGESRSAFGSGVYGTNTNSSGAGVRGETRNGNGVEGIVDWTNIGTGTGVYGSGGFYGAAGYFENANTSIPAVTIQNVGGSTTPGLVVTGTTHLEGQLTWKPVTSYLSIIPAAFEAANSGDLYIQRGYYLRPDGVSAVTFYAPVELPHGATVTKFTFHWSDSSASDGSAKLFRDDPTGAKYSMAQAATTGNSGQSSSTDTTISNAVIDNSRYGYYIQMDLPDLDVIAYEIFVEYTIGQPH